MKTKCKCGSIIESDGPRSMKRCKCGIKWGYTVNIDNTIHLFENGRHSIDPEKKKRPACVSWSHEQESKTQAKGWTKQKLLDWAYKQKIG